MKKTFLSIIALLLCLSTMAQYKPTEDNIKAREQFQNEKFGIFIHWGIYSMMGRGEWVMNNESIKYKEYQKIAAGFYPSKFNAEEWVDAIKASGAKYITITTRHHDGFSMFDSKASDYNIVAATPFKRDVIKELADACHKEGINIHFYYSHLDWHRTDYPLGRTGRKLGRPTDQQNWKSYQKFMDDQLTELLTNYGKVGAIWFDGYWDHDSDAKPFDWELSSQYALIHKLQPQCLVADNHHLPPFAGEDVQIFERDLPGENKAGYSSQNGISRLPLETCETMNGSWGYNINDNDYKSSKEIIQLLVRAAGKNANLLLNIGPEPNGELPSRAIERLKEIGTWMNKYGETIYGTRGGIVAPHDWGVSTQKGDRLFIHILNLQDNALFIPLMGKKVTKGTVFASGKTVKYSTTTGGVVLNLPETPKDIDYVVELKIK
jgi:alpha-L-fucosidase